MKPEQFVIWLTGYLAAAEDKGLTDAQVKFILQKLENKTSNYFFTEDGSNEGTTFTARC